MAITRRSLIGRGALLVASGFLAPSFITRTALALDGQQGLTDSNGVLLDPTKKNRILVVIQLSGGNDGINTLVPFGDPAYAQMRTSLALPTANLHVVGDGVGLHPEMRQMKALWDQGKAAIVQGVGYPNPNRSHFRSMDIWHTARPDVFERTGWLGKYVSACQCGQETPLPAISVGDQLNGAFWTDMALVPSVASIGAFSFQ